ncbi:MAG TPA: DUF3618 domain-containing protein [Roseomonas sp.]|nr:DUF3618 domain-containing protein [Roseomonas sp.]
MSETTDPHGQSSAEIEADVERTRARVTDTIEALRDRMSPGQVMDQLVDYARESGGADFMRNLGASVRDNPLPLLLVGAGLGWMMLSSGRRPVTYPATRRPDPDMALLPPPSAGPGLGTRAGEAARHAGERVQGTYSDMRHRTASGMDSVRDSAAQTYAAGADMAGRATGSVRDTASSTYAAGADMASRAAETASDAAARVGRTASNLAGQASEGLHSAGRSVRASYYDASDSVARGYGTASEQAGMLADRTRAGLSRVAEEQPLLFGALGLALGAALGAMLPRTRTEDRLMGEASDALTNRATTALQEGYEQAKQTAAEHLEQGKAALGETYARSQEELKKGDLSPGKVADVVSNAAAEVKKAATDTVHGVKEEAKSGIDAAAPEGSSADNKPGTATPGSTTGKPGATAGSSEARSPLASPSTTTVPPRPTSPPF